MNEWIKISELPQLEDTQFCVFAKWYPNWNTFVNQEAGQWRMFRDHRDYDLNNTYTHFILLPSSPPEK